MRRPQSKLSPAPSTGFRSTWPRWLRKLLSRWLATRRSSRFPANSSLLCGEALSLALERNSLAVCQLMVRSGCLAGRRWNAIFPRSIVTVQTKSQSSTIHRVVRRASRRRWRSCLSRPVRTKARCMMRRAARLEAGREDPLLRITLSVMGNYVASLERGAGNMGGLPVSWFQFPVSIFSFEFLVHGPALGPVGSIAECRSIGNSTTRRSVSRSRKTSSTFPDASATTLPPP